MPHEIRQMPCEDFDNLVLFYEWKYEEEKKAREEAEKKNKRKRGR